MQPTTTTRKAIYDLIWSRPMSQVAQDFGISDVALKKICRKHRVPSPARGYWAKKAGGKPVKQFRLVETDDPLKERVTIYGSNVAALPEPVRKVLQEARVSRTNPSPIAQPSPTTVLVAIDELHRSIVATAKALRKHRPDKDGVVSATGNGCCGIAVGASSVERCIVVIDALAKALAVRGLAIVPGGSNMSVTTDGQTIAFRLSEFVRRDKHAPTPDELAAEERRRKRLRITWDSPYGRAYPEWDFVRTGQLRIELDNQYADGLRRTWKDGKRQRLEHLIDDIATGIVAYGVALRIKEEEYARRQRNYERRRRAEQRAHAREQRENERAQVLDEVVAISTEASKLRTWLQEAKRWPDRQGSDEFTRFVQWARNRLGELEHAVDPDGIADSLRSRELFPENDTLVDLPDDLIEE